MNINFNSNSLPAIKPYEDPLNNLQLELSEIKEAFEIIQKIPLHERPKVIECVIALRKMNINNWEGPLTDLQLLNALITKVDSSHRAPVLNAMTDLVQEGFPGANDENLLGFLNELSKKNELAETLAIARRFFLDRDENSHNCTDCLVAASEELKSGMIQKEFTLHLKEEVIQTLEFTKKKVSPFNIQKALPLLLKTPLEERQELIDHAATLVLMKMRDDDNDGYPMSFLTALETLEKLPANQRNKVVHLLFDLYKQGAAGAEESTVLDFFIKTPESILNPALRIGKGAFFDYRNKEKNNEILKGTYKEEDGPLCGFTDYECIVFLRFISKIIPSLSEEQIKAFENLKIKNELQDHDERKKILYKILFGNQESIRHFAFELAKGDYQLFQFVKEIVQNTPLQSLFEQWLLTNSKDEEQYQARNTLQELNQEICQVYSVKNPTSYVPNLSKPFPKNLIARHAPLSKDHRRGVKKALELFLDQKFDAEKEKNTTPQKSRIKFELNNDKYDFFGNGSLVKNDEKKVFLRPDEWGLISPGLLFYNFNGNQLERITLENDEAKVKKTQLNDQYWDNWEVYSGADYKNEIDPMICQAVQTILQSKFWHTPPTVLDVGGGTGRLASSLLNLGHPLNYILLEKNEAEIDRAKSILGEKGVVVPTDIVEDIFYRDTNKTIPLEPGSVDIAIASGVLNFRVLKNKEEALIALKKISSAVKPRGFILLTGLSNSHISAEDLENEGFEVINKSLPQSSRQFYIARKKDEPLASKLCLDHALLKEVEKILSTLPKEEREDASDHLVTLQKMQMRDQGVLLTTLPLLEMVVKIPSWQRALVINCLFSLFINGIEGANEKSVLDFLIQESARGDFFAKFTQVIAMASKNEVNDHFEMFYGDSKIKIKEENSYAYCMECLKAAFVL